MTTILTYTEEGYTVGASLRQGITHFAKGKDMRTAIFFGIIGFIGGLLTASCESTLGSLLSAEELKDIMDTLPDSFFLLALLTGFQVSILTFVTAFIGIRAS